MVLESQASMTTAGGPTTCPVKAHILAPRTVFTVRLCECVCLCLCESVCVDTIACVAVVLIRVEMLQRAMLL